MKYTIQNVALTNWDIEWRDKHFSYAVFYDNQVMEITHPSNGVDEKKHDYR